MGIAENYIKTYKNVMNECAHAERAADSVCLLAVSKTVGLDGVAEAIEGGARSFGENRPDQLMLKHDAYPDVDWHFIGNIQSRRIKDIVPRACLIHSLFEDRHARKIDEEAAKIGKMQKVLIEVNVSGEASKSGVAPGDAQELLDLCLKLPHVVPCGLMTMAPQGDLDAARKCFAGLRDLRSALQKQIAATDPEAANMFDQLSMGMTDDWLEAIQEGSTIVRIGRAIFA